MRRDVEFDAEGTKLAGWLYVPDDDAGPAPCIVMAHGFSAVKEQRLDRFADAFAVAGLAALVFDQPNFGASGGQPRQEIDPVLQLRAYRHAITCATTLEEVDAERIGAWGTSYSGGLVLELAAIDRRVRCVVSQVPLISGYRSSQRRIRADQLPTVLARFDADRLARFRGQAPATVPVVSDDPNVACALPGQEPFRFFTETQRTVAPSWRNEVTLRSLELTRGYEPVVHVPRISPTPLMMIVALGDTLTPVDLMLEAYESALEPKKLVLMDGDHFDPYESRFGQAAKAATAWFVEHLLR